MLTFLYMEVSPSPKLSGIGASQPEGRRKFCRLAHSRGTAARRNGESGAGNLKAIVWTAILVAFIYVTAMVLPILINEYEFQDGLREIARFASVNRKSSDLIQKEVLAEAQKEDLQIDANDVKVVTNGGNVHINVDYSVTVDLKVYQWTLNFHPDASNSAII